MALLCTTRLKVSRRSHKASKFCMARIVSKDQNLQLLTIIHFKSLVFPVEINFAMIFCGHYVVTPSNLEDRIRVFSPYVNNQAQTDEQTVCGSGKHKQFDF
ncbi:hypothetical protein NL676_027107 [Syzygium grande]|nr:hypothetical protein NL676_027107 [Syzygium grande]